MATKIESAVERVLAVASREADPRAMSQQDAVDFYEQLASECRQWAEKISEEMGG